MEVQPEVEKPAFLGKLDLNLIVRGAQMNNGIKRGDFQRYRNYCTGKVKKIRKSMNFKYSTPKVKYSSKRIELERAKDPRVLQVLLFNAEKNWAHANEVKSTDNAKLKKTRGSRAKYTIINKLKRSVVWAKKLEQLCRESSERKSAVEAESYREYLQGMCLFEQEKWSDSSKSLIRCREILSELVKVSDSLTVSILHERIDQIDQSIKYCTFKESKGKQLSINEILAMKKFNEPSLRSRLQNLAQGDEAQVKSDNFIEINGERYPLESQKIISEKNRVDELKQEFEVMDRQWVEKQQDEASSESYFNFLTEILLAHDQVIRIVDKEKDDPKHSQSDKELLVRISLHYQQEKLKLLLKRQERFFVQSYNDSKSEDPAKAKKAAPQTLAKILTNSITIINQIIQAEKQQAAVLNKPVPINTIKQLDELSFYYRTVRLHFVAQVYFNNSKLKEAYSLWTQADRCIQICKSKDRVNEGMFSLKVIDQLVRVGRLNSWIEFSSKSDVQLKEVEQGVESLKIKEPIASKLTLQQLVKNPAKLSQIPMEVLSELPVCEVPPPVGLMPCRPIFYDLMDQHVQYPNLEQRAKEENKGGWFWNKLKIFK